MRDYRNKIKFEIAKVTQDIVDSNEFKITKTVTITLDIIVNSNYYSIVFTLHLKDSIVCHVNCELGMESNSGTDHFIHCSCMGTNNKCTICNCGPRSRYHAMVKLITLNKVLEVM
ncbi:hypothetical protein F8M41_025783 [Gigaspora margarita]|uniref:Uncharacterized protein n=1 Tax=Gigaspora margarita TaxID=4874 RepID=A0A8H3XHY2_GIGMA|nr:hypothetical protein F8M41_025783 [Gigaspora margarita]